MTNVGHVHVAFSVSAIISGAIVLFANKGTVFHRWMGRVYVVGMLGLNVTALMIYRLFGVFGPFHVLALLSLGFIAAGIIPVWTRRPKDRWLQRHYRFITGSYLGLIAALVAEIAVRVPAIRPQSGMMFGAMVIGGSLFVGIIGGPMIERGKRTTLARHMARLTASDPGVTTR
ncbi:MAG TPA: DUF2306 domain-containing protein [Gemmatimonadaceae bacterium]|nr:DUF2306 domain-containing protein [Gemmatimonadaceae bacterium]